jgi:hypothetical protein
VVEPLAGPECERQDGRPSVETTPVPSRLVQATRMISFLAASRSRPHHCEGVALEADRAQLPREWQAPLEHHAFKKIPERALRHRRPRPQEHMSASGRQRPTNRTGHRRTLRFRMRRPPVPSRTAPRSRRRPPTPAQAAIDRGSLEGTSSGEHTTLAGSCLAQDQAIKRLRRTGISIEAVTLSPEPRSPEVEVARLF